MTESQPPFSTRITEPIYTATKAIWAAVVGFAGLLAMVVSSMGDGVIDGPEWGRLVEATLAFAVTVGTVYNSTNKPKKT